MNEKSNKEGKPVKICPAAIVTSTPLFLVHKHLCCLQKYLWRCFLIWFAKFCCLTSLFLQISKWIPFAVRFFFLRQGMFMPDCCSYIFPPSSHSTGALCRAGIHKWRIHVERARLWQVFCSANPLSNSSHTLNGTFISRLMGKYRQWNCWLCVTVPLSQLHMTIILFISLELSCSWFIPSPANKTVTGVKSFQFDTHARQSCMFEIRFFLRVRKKRRCSAQLRQLESCFVCLLIQKFVTF